MGLKTEESFDQMSNSSHNGNSEDDLMDILNIPKDHLLDQNSPERLDDLPQEQQDSEEELQMDTLNTPTIMMPDPWGRSGAQVIKSQHNVYLPQRNGDLIQTDSTSRTDLAQILVVFTVFFILLLCIVQIFSNSLGLPLTTLPLIGITSILSVAIVGAKFARA